jgi:hypothetical protein
MQVMNRSYQIFRKLLVFNSSVLFAMSLQRLVLFLIVVRHWVFGVSSNTVAGAFFAGFRFDLCVLAYFNIPVLLITWWICSDRMIQTQNPTLKALRKWSLWVYLGLATLVIHVLAMLDLFFFATSGRRWTFADWQAQGFDFLYVVVAKWGALFSGGLVAFFLLLWVFRSVFILFRVQLHTVDVPEGRQNFARDLVLGVILPILALALAARGTLTAHHLGKEHAEVSQIEGLNQLALSPVWAFDKKF